jgi:hypothetical protein
VSCGFIENRLGREALVVPIALLMGLLATVYRDARAVRPAGSPASP